MHIVLLEPEIPQNAGQYRAYLRSDKFRPASD